MLFLQLSFQKSFSKREPRPSAEDREFFRGRETGHGWMMPRPLGAKYGPVYGRERTLVLMSAGVFPCSCAFVVLLGLVPYNAILLHLSECGNCERFEAFVGPMDSISADAEAFLAEI